MKRFFKALAVLTLAVGALLFSEGFFGALPRGTYIDGVSVGGMSRTAAVAAVRRSRADFLRSQRLVVCAGGERLVFRYPEFNFADDLTELVGGISRRGSYRSSVHIYLNGAREIADSVCARIDRAPVEPYAVFNASGEPFTYFTGGDGAVADRAALLADIDGSLNGGFGEVTVRVAPVARKKSMCGVKRETSLMYSFSTVYDPTNAPRSANIALAASKINGTVLAAGEEFSFNRTVGERTAANGFAAAKIISEGRFVEGVGGGVCQVSTTLYNAALLSGLRLTEYHPHSLRVGYVEASRDAMVSGTRCDLRFVNTRPTPVYIRMSASGGRLTCSVYGLGDGVERSFRSVVTGTIPQPADVVEEGGEEECVISRGSPGTESCGYLVEVRGGVRTTRLVRRDRYAASPNVIRRPSAAGGCL